MSAVSDLTEQGWQQFSRLLDEALELPAEERTPWLEALGAEHAAVKPALRRVLERHSDAHTGRWLDTLPHTVSAPVDADSDLKPHALVGPYRLVRELGVGGMGAVWLAERADGTLKRQVALKLPRAGPEPAGSLKRISRERHILASLEHPNIDGCTTQDRCSGSAFLALEYVEGQPIDA